MRWRAAVGILGFLPLVACGGSPVGPDLRPLAAAPRDLYVTWDATIPDTAAQPALERLQRALGDAVSVHAQQHGRPEIHIGVDMAVIEAHPAHPAGTARVDGPCAGAAILRDDATWSSYLILHEIGHILIGYPHSPYALDLMNANDVQQRPDGSYVLEFSPREVGILRANLAAGCTRIESWAGL